MMLNDILAYLIIWHDIEQIVSILVSYDFNMVLNMHPTIDSLVRKSTSSSVAYYFNSISITCEQSAKRR
jgi:hypothetical protein